MKSGSWRKITITCLFGLATYIFSGPITAKTLKNCGAGGDSGGLTVYEFYGEAELDNFGTGLDSAGDFNGDGIVDIVAGAPFSDAGAQDGGAAYVFLGGAPGDPNYDFRLLAEAADDQLGFAVAGVGDLDNDGFDDIAIGARYNERAGVDRGAVWVIFGSEPPFGLRRLVLTGDVKGPKAFGHALAGGDFNGDGYSDLVVAAPFDVVRGIMDYELGKVYIFFGGPEIGTTADLTVGAEDLNHEFGWSVACGGDLNNDGYDDLVVGARYYGSWQQPQRGKAYVFFGGNPMDTIADLELVGENTYCWLGYGVAGAGDVNGDGFDDLLVSSPYHPGGPGTNPAYGRVYLLLGGTLMNDTPDVVFDGVAAGDQFGWSVDGGLDMNNSGYDDIIIGARFNDCASQDGGAAYVYYGGALVDVVPDISVGSVEADDALGTSVAMIGDWGLRGSPMAAASAVWNDAGKDVSDPMREGAFGAVFGFVATFSRVGDFDGDGCVGWTDLAAFSQRWLERGCSDPNWCGKTDIDQSTAVNLFDFALLADRWQAGCN